MSVRRPHRSLPYAAFDPAPEGKFERVHTPNRGRVRAESAGVDVDGTPQVAATDGGTGVIDADGDERPDDCQCWDADGELPCWPCYRDGFDVPNPSAGEE